MSMLHEAFLLDYSAFKSHIAPLTEALGRGDQTRLVEAARQIALSVAPEEWILHNAGTMLEDVGTAGELSSQEIGYCLLVVLSTHLTRAPSLGIAWSALSTTLFDLGWPEEDVKLLIHGLPVVRLLRNETEAPDTSFLNGGEPYWYWVFPTQSFRRGWLPTDVVTRLHAKLNASMSSLEPAISHPEAIRHNLRGSSQEHGHAGASDMAFRSALAMLDEAQRSAKALYLVIS